MAARELINYIADQLKMGLGPEDIKKSLLETGWDEQSIDEAYQELGAPLSVGVQASEYMMEGFFPPPSYKRAIRRLAIFCVGAGAAALFLYMFTR